MIRSFWLQAHLGRGALIGALVVLVYAGSLRNPFQYDDIHSISENPHIRSLAKIPVFFVDPELFSVDPRNAMYRPLVLVSYALNYALSGADVWSYHVFNLGVHLGVSLLVYALVCQLGGAGAHALLSGLLFALHPLSSEPVNYICSRSETICAFFVLLGLLAYVRGGRAWLLVALASFAAALLAKSVAIALVALVVVYDLVYRNKAPGLVPFLCRHGGFWLIGVAYLVAVWGAIDTAVISDPVRSLTLHILTQVKALVYYLKLLCLPQGLSVEHQFALARGAGDGAVLAAFLCLAGVVGVACWWRSKELVFWGGWAVLTLSPSSIVPLNVLVNEHRLYLPLVAFAVLLARLLLGAVRDRGRVGVALVTLWLGIYGVLCWQRTQVWQSPETLWGDALRKGPHMPRPHLFLGDWHQQAGRHEEALREYAQARTVNPQAMNATDLLVSYNNQGAAFLALGRSAEAIESYRHALAIDSTYARSRGALDALVALQEQEWDSAAHVLHKRGLMLLIEGRPAEAVVALEQSLRRQVRLETYRALGMAFEQLGKVEQQRQVYAALKVLAPGSPFSQAAAEKLKQLEGKR